ncbi:hypothetical protein SAMN05660226_03526 [Parapedobacter luteus]|uniref:3-keto-disaccharide hydrolase domain-containing protein n=2 Tax=Sphingobacteriaceae TaxID=84566 RepID=A0A1T5ET47_9SPHI|nr:hypothetical protein SAMN05660226_03526 [Parapedobacter luteus]
MSTNNLTTLICCLSLLGSATAQQRKPSFPDSNGMAIPLDAAHWQNDSGKVVFEQIGGVPIMRLLPMAGFTWLKDFDFTTGTIEFDWQPTDTTFSHFNFRYQSSMESECVYLRTARAGDSLAMDAVQYAPFIKGVNLWDMLLHFQATATFSKREWNRIKLIISEKQLLIFINDLSTPRLWVPELEGDVTSGTLAFSGEGLVANLAVKPGDTEGLPHQAGLDPTANDPRYLRQWLVSDPMDFPFGREPADLDLPKPDARWTDHRAERRGLLNITRLHGSKMPERQLIWIKARIRSAIDQQKWMDFGFSDEVWLFVNGSYTYADKNYYGTPIMKPPFGRCSIENTAVYMPLKKGDNEILIGLANNFYGWGVVARLRDLHGIEALE